MSCDYLYHLKFNDSFYNEIVYYVISVRDATARLPNGMGTRSDICTLLKDSQYLMEANQTELHNAVSGALDRLHYEHDPCVKYDPKRKIWIYLHRGRTLEEFGIQKIIIYY